MPPVSADHLLAPVLPADGPARTALDRVRAMGFRFVQLGITRPGLRPRDLDGSARRDLAATLRRLELSPAGLDAWIPAAHLVDPAHVDRAVAALLAAIDLAADLGRPVVSVALPATASDEEHRHLDPALVALADRAELVGVRLADHTVRPDGERDPRFAVGVDPAACLASGVDPVAALVTAGSELASARLVDLLASGVRAPVGDLHEGRLDVDAYRATLATFAAELPVVLDARQWSDPWAGFARSAEAWHAAAPA